MSKINITNLTFGYEGSFDNIFENVSFTVDTDWKLGFIGRNGKGKTTFLNLLMGKYKYQGSIQTPAAFDCFPYQISDEQMKRCIADFFEELAPDLELWRILMELEKMEMDAQLLYRPFATLSLGERTRVMLAVLFSRDNYFLLIDEPTNHLDKKSREMIKGYLQKKQGFLLVSHDRDLLDACIDHILVLNRVSIDVQKGNFSSWWENKRRTDAFQMSENEKHRKEIVKLQEAARRADGWAQKNESTKIGYDPVKEHDRSIDRGYIGAQTKRMQKRVKQMQIRIAHEIEEKEGLLQDIENPVDLKIMPLVHHKDVLIWAQKYTLSYGEHSVLREFDFTLHQGERVLLRGANGSGKSSFIKAILRRNEEQSAGGSRSLETVAQDVDTMTESGVLQTASGLIISYVNQDTSCLKGDLKSFCLQEKLDESLLKAILRQLDLERVQFGKRMEEYSEGQKKKVLMAASLLRQAHLYIWDEPLNYIDIFSRMQIEELILRYQPTMLLVEHDVCFQEKVATRMVEF